MSKLDKIKSLKKSANPNLITVTYFEKNEKISLKTMFEFNRYILS